MLKFLRNKKNQKKIYIVLTLAILPAFLFWGVSVSEKGASQTSTLGILDNRKITVKEYMESYKAVDHQFRWMYGEEAAAIAKFMNLRGEAWDRLLLLNHAKKNNIKVTDQEVVAWITRQSIFLSKNTFNTDFYNRYVTTYLRMSVRDFEEEIRKLLTVEKVYAGLRAKIAISDEEIQSAYTQENAQRDLDYVAIALEGEKSQVVIGEEDLKNAYPAFQKDLTEAPKVKLRYLFVSKETAAAKPGLFSDDKSTMEELAKTAALEIQETPLFSENEAIPGIGLSNVITDKSFSLELNKESEWLHLDQGSYKIKPIEKKTRRLLTFEESKDKLRDILRKQKALEAAMKKLTDLREKIKTSDFDTVFAASGLEIKHVEKLAADGYLAGVGPADSYRHVLLPLKEGEASEAFPTQSGAAILRVKKIWPVDLKNLEKAKVDLKEKLIQEKFRKEMTTLLDSLRIRLKLNLDLMRQIFAAEELAENP